MKMHSRHLRKNQRRNGTTMTEFAIVAPLLFLFFFAALEFCRVAMIRHTADNAVYEGCRMAIVPGGTANDAEQTAQQLLTTLGLTRTDISVTPRNIRPDTEEVTVTVSVPLDDNTFIPPVFVGGHTVVRTLTMRREGV